MANKHPNQAEVEKAFEAYRQSLFRYALYLTRSPEKAEDVTQDTFAKLCQADFDKIAANLKAWLFKVCRNHAFGLMRKENRMSELNDTQLERTQSKTPPPDVQAGQNDFFRVILKLVEKLPEKLQEVIRLKFKHQLSYQEISEVSELSVSNVGFILHTALKKLRRQMLDMKEV